MQKGSRNNLKFCYLKGLPKGSLNQKGRLIWVLWRVPQTELKFLVEITALCYTWCQELRTHYDPISHHADYGLLWQPNKSEVLTFYFTFSLSGTSSLHLNRGGVVLWKGRQKSCTYGHETIFERGTVLCFILCVWRSTFLMKAGMWKGKGLNFWAKSPRTKFYWVLPPPHPAVSTSLLFDFHLTIKLLS